MNNKPNIDMDQKIQNILTEQAKQGAKVSVTDEPIEGTDKWEECNVCRKRFIPRHCRHIYCSYRCNDASRYYRSRKKRVEKEAERYTRPEVKKRKIESSLRSRELYPRKWKARQDLRNAVTQGKIIKGTCSICSELKVEGHHNDYTKPLKVIWLCHTHHMERHRKYGQI